ncbi:hypothetical protein ACFLSY_03345 [Bacteroidota bacterium]
MRKNKVSPYLIPGIICALLTGLIYYFLHYVELEGYNPSDDGVILAQSFRLFNGEIPHKDFISIRPVFSSILHGIHLISPLPMQISARWFIIFQYFTYSFLWSYLIFSIYKFKFSSPLVKVICYVAMAYFAFLLSNIYNLFPWTTVDAIFISIIALWIFNKMFSPGLLPIKQSIYCASGLFLFALAGISRQSFIIIALVFFILVIFIYLKKKKYISLLAILFFGSLPLTLYLIYLVYHDALWLFITQMTGRTELLQTGIVRFATAFTRSWLMPVHLIALSGLLFIKIKNTISNKTFKNGTLFKNQQLIIFCFRIIYLFAAIVFSAILFIFPELMFKCSFELFWINLISGLAIILIIKPGKEKSALIIFSVLIAWTSAISLGDNAPVFTAGILGANIIGLFFLFDQQISLTYRFKISTKYIYAIFPGLILFFLLALYGQRKSNYRDLPSSQLNKELSSINPGFGKIRTNINTFKYFIELNYVIEQLGGINVIKDRVVVAPNNSLFYPLNNTRNPFPVDWLQREEYIGSENLLHSRIKETLEKEEIFIILDKCDSKRMAGAYKEITISGEKYDYIEILTGYCEEINVNSELFFVLKSNPY